MNLKNNIYEYFLGQSCKFLWWKFRAMLVLATVLLICIPQDRSLLSSILRYGWYLTCELSVHHCVWLHDYVSFSGDPQCRAFGGVKPHLPFVSPYQQLI